MAPKKKKIPFENYSVFGLKTLRDNKWSHETMATYYTDTLHVPISRRTVERWLTILEKQEGENVN